MTAGRPVRLMMTVALPLMLGNVFQQLYTVVDAAVVGRGIGVAALAALGSSDWLHWMWLSLLQGLTQGFAIPAAHAFGARDPGALKRIAGNTALLTLAVSAAITALALSTIGLTLSLLGTPAEIRPIAAGYLSVLFSGLPVVALYNLLSGLLRALGDGRTPLMAMAAASVCNIILDLLFVLVLGWGVRGAAAATLIAQALSAAFCFMHLTRLPFMRLGAPDFRPDGALIKRLVRLGLPISFQNLTISVGGMIVQSVVNGMGVVFLAGYTATNKLYGLLEMAAVSYGYAISVYAGQNLGAKRPDRIRLGVRAGLRVGVLTALSITALMLLFGRTIIGLFLSPGESAGAMEYALEFLRIMSASLPILYILYVVRSTLQGIGNTVVPMISGIAEFIMRTGSAFILPRVIGHTGVFWAEVLAWIGADLILIPGYLRAGRSMTSIRRNDNV